MLSTELQSTLRDYEMYLTKNGITEDLIDAYVLASQTAIEEDAKDGLKVSARCKELLNQFVFDQTNGMDIWSLERYQQDSGSTPYDIIEKFYEVLKYESLHSLESFILYMERNRPHSKRFYLPRRKTLKCVVEDLQDLEDRKDRREFYGLSMPSRVGKSTVCIFFLSWIAYKRPNSHSAMGGHSGILAKSFYKELMNLLTTAEYTFKELFDYAHPEYINKPFPTDKSADEFTITLGDPDRFATITCRGIDGTWTGAVDVSADGYLYVDDLVRDREHSLSPQRMENTFQEYLNKMVDRKNDGARELMVGTLWNVLDPLERIRVMYEMDKRYYFRRIPALDGNDKSNFDYEINGFSTEYYKAMREKLSNAEWMAKYQQSPYVREGLLFPANECQYFDGTLPEEECKSWAVCDPAFGGADRLSMPIIKDYGKVKKIVAWVHRSGTQSVTVPKIVDAIEKHYVTELHIEQNSGGKLMTDSIKAELQRRDIRHCMIIPYYASTRLPKAEKIKGYSDWVKENLMFLLPNSAYDNVTDEIYRYKRDEDYQLAMDELHMYTSEGKNTHDDSADVLSQIAIIDGKKKKQTKIISSLL